MNVHLKEYIEKDGFYELVEEKDITSHIQRCSCKCTNRVQSLIGGKIIWTRIKFSCGEIIKINCARLKKW